MKQPLTLQEAKDKVAQRYNFCIEKGQGIPYSDWESMEDILIQSSKIGECELRLRLHEAAELYKSSHVEALEEESKSLKQKEIMSEKDARITELEYLLEEKEGALRVLLGVYDKKDRSAEVKEKLGFKLKD